jgi:hypothetical protein
LIAVAAMNIEHQAAPLPLLGYRYIAVQRALFVQGFGSNWLQQNSS